MYAETQIYIGEDIAIAILPALIRKHIEFECRPNNNGLCRIVTGFNNLGVVNHLIAEQTIKVEESEAEDSWGVNWICPNCKSEFDNDESDAPRCDCCYCSWDGFDEVIVV